MKSVLPIGLVAAFCLTGVFAQAPQAEKLPHANNLLSKQQVERVTGLKGLVPKLRDFKNGAPGDINIRRADGVFVVSLTVQPPEFYDRWLSFHKDLAVELSGVGDVAFGRKIPNPFEGDSAAKPQEDNRLYGPPAPPELAALYIRRGDVAFTISRLPFESTAPPGVSNAQLYLLAEHVLQNLDALTPAEEPQAPTAESEAAQPSEQPDPAKS